MAVLTGYFDESGTHDAMTHLVVAGFVADRDGWIRFSKNWCEALRDQSVPYFKAQWFDKRKKFFGTKDWDDENRRRDFMGRLLSTINSIDPIPFSSSLTMVDFNEIITPGKVRNKVGSGYTLCGQTCLGRVGLWANENDQNEPVDYIFDAGHKNRREFEIAHENETEESIKRFRVGTLTFADERCIPPLQAADLFAYELAQYLSGRTRRHPFHEVINSPERSRWNLKWTRKALIAQRNKLCPDTPFISAMGPL